MLFANVVSNTTIILMYDEPGPETFMINMAIFFKTVFYFPYETKNILHVYNFIILYFCEKWLANFSMRRAFKQF